MVRLILACILLAAIFSTLRVLFSNNAVTVTGNLANIAKSFLEIVAVFKQ